MNNEIKEMLEQMESIAITGKDKNGIKVDGYGLRQNDLKILLDYITNLQQELEIMVKDDERSQETIIKLSKENERLKEWKEDLLKENIELENIRKEAIEYIKEHCEIVRFTDEEGSLVDKIGKIEGIPLLNILQNWK